MLVTLLTGCNLGDKDANMIKVVSLIEQRIGRVVKKSSVHSSIAWGFKSDDVFLNQALLCETSLEPMEVLFAIWEIEKLFGKDRGTAEEELIKFNERKAGKREYESRNMDIDIIFYGDIVLNTPLLTIPHPLYKERDFVLTPLNEL